MNAKIAQYCLLHNF